MTDRQLMRQALDVINCECGFGGSNDYDPREIAAALSERLAQPEPGTWREVTYDQLMEEVRNRGYEIRNAKIIAPQPKKKPVAWVYPEGLEALKSGRPWTAYGSNGYSRIPLYLSDAVAPKAEPPAAESGAGFESLPASPTWWDQPAQMNYRKWQGLTEEETDELVRRFSRYELLRAIEAKLKEKNT